MATTAPVVAEGKILDLIRHTVDFGEIKNLSKVTKDVLAATVVYLARRITHQEDYRNLIHAIAAMSTPSMPAPTANNKTAGDASGGCSDDDLAPLPLPQT